MVEMLYGKEKLKAGLPPKKQQEYLELAYHGDNEARKILFEHNLRLVMLVIKRHYSEKSIHDKEDLFQIGSIGLWKAIERFDINYGRRFSTYAMPMIYGKMRIYGRDNNLIHIPRDIRTLSYDINKLINKYFITNNRIPSIYEISVSLNTTEQEITLAMNIDNGCISTSEPLPLNRNDEEEDFTLDEMLHDETFSIDEELEKEELNTTLIKAIRRLPLQQQQVIMMLTGFNCTIKSQREAATILNVSQPQVCRLNKKAIAELGQEIPQRIQDEAYLDRRKKLIKEKVFVKN